MLADAKVTLLGHDFLQSSQMFSSLKVKHQIQKKQISDFFFNLNKIKAKMSNNCELQRLSYLVSQLQNIFIIILLCITNPWDLHNGNKLENITIPKWIWKHFLRWTRHSTHENRNVLVRTTSLRRLYVSRCITSWWGHVERNGNYRHHSDLHSLFLVVVICCMHVISEEQASTCNYNCLYHSIIHHHHRHYQCSRCLIRHLWLVLVTRGE